MDEYEQLSIEELNREVNKHRRPRPQPGRTMPNLVEGKRHYTKRMMELVRSYKFHRK